MDEQCHPKNLVVNFQYISGEDALTQIAEMCGLDSVIAALGVDKQLRAAEARAREKEMIILAALDEAYQAEVVDTGMEDLIIGPGCEYADEQDWKDGRRGEWRETAALFLAQAQPRQPEADDEPVAGTA
jgi:hypothetical protein